MLSTLYSCPILMELEFSRPIFEKSSNTKFHKLRPVEAELFYADERTDMTKLIVVFHNFATALIKLYNLHVFMYLSTNTERLWPYM